MPIYPVLQEHDGVPPRSLHSEYAPHGEGTHGLIGVCTIGAGGGAKLRYIL